MNLQGNQIVLSSDQFCKKMKMNLATSHSWYARYSSHWVASNQGNDANIVFVIYENL